jgi:hypothetical protein
MTGDFTRSSGGEPFGGERIGTVSIHSTDRRTTVSTDQNASPVMETCLKVVL